MKISRRILSLVLAVVVLSVFFFNVTAESKKVNLCRFFNDSVGFFVGEFIGGDIDWSEQTYYEKFKVEYCFIEYIHYLLGKEGKLEGYISHGPEGEYDCNMPYSLFEEKLNALFNYEGDPKSFEHYNGETDTMRFMSSEFSSSMGHPAYVIGYNELGDDSYDVYVQRMQLGFGTPQEALEEFPFASEEDLYIDYNGFYHVVHSDIFYRVRVTYDGESLFYNHIEKLTSIDGIDMITRDGSLWVEDDDVIIDADDGVFPIGTQVIIDKLTEGAEFIVAQKAMLEISNKYTVYEITATKDKIEIQPDGTVNVTFKAPNGYNVSKLSVYYVSDSGEVEKLNISVNKTDKTVTVHLTHLSTYVLAEVEFIQGDLDGDGEISVSDALVVLRIAAKIVEQTDEALAIGDVDSDGEITVSDALAILRVAAKISVGF